MSGNIQTWQHRTLISESILSFFFPFYDSLMNGLTFITLKQRIKRTKRLWLLLKRKKILLIHWGYEQMEKVVFSQVSIWKILAETRVWNLTSIARVRSFKMCMEQKQLTL